MDIINSCNSYQLFIRIGRHKILLQNDESGLDQFDIEVLEMVVKSEIIRKKNRKNVITFL